MLIDKFLVLGEKIFYDLVDPISILSFCNGISIHLLSWSEFLKNSPEFSTRETIFLFERLVFLDDSERCVFKSQTRSNLIFKKFLFPASAISCKSLVALGNLKKEVKENVYVRFVQKFNLVFLVK